MHVFRLLLIKRQDWHKELVTFYFGMPEITFQLTLAAVEYASSIYNFQQSFVKHLKFEEIKATMSLLNTKAKDSCTFLFSPVEIS